MRVIHHDGRRGTIRPNAKTFRRDYLQHVDWDDGPRGYMHPVSGEELRPVSDLEEELLDVAERWAERFLRGQAGEWAGFEDAVATFAAAAVLSDAQYSYRPALTMAEAYSEALDAEAGVCDPTRQRQRPLGYRQRRVARR